MAIKRPRDVSFFTILVILASVQIIYQFMSAKPVREVKYSEFRHLVSQRRIKSVYMGSSQIAGSMLPSPKEDKRYIGKDGTVRFMLDQLPLQQRDETLIPELMAIGVEFEGKSPSRWLEVLNWIFPLVFLGIIFYGYMRANQRMGQEVMSFGRTKAKIYAEKDTRTTFQEVAGCDEAKEELVEIIEFLKDPRRFQELGGKIPKGVLLVGPPGTGKTLLARAVAGEAGVPFFSISGSEFMEMFVGVGASRVRDMFVQAKQKAPCIVFIDEIDAVGRQRGAGLGGGHDEREQTLNQLLVEMDGFDTQKGVIIMAATNRPDVLDPALLRPGRFDRRIVVPVSGLEGRIRILEVHAKGKPLDPSVKLEVIAKRTPGFTGADLANAVNEAALLAARRRKSVIEMVDFEDAIDRVITGPQQRSRVLSEREKKVVAIHESGHALVAYFTEHSDPIHKVSIIPRGYGALGFTMQLPTEDRYLKTKEELLSEITVLLGGRCAEEIVLNEISTGAHNDLERSTDLMRDMICAYGMSPELGPLTYGRRQHTVFLGRDLVEEARNFSEKTAQLIDQEIRVQILCCKDRATSVLRNHVDELHLLAQALIDKEDLDLEQLQAILEPGLTPRPVPPPLP